MITARVSDPARRADSAAAPAGEPHLSSHDARRHLAAATTACTAVCTVLGGALISANTTHAAPAAAAPEVRTAAVAAEFPDRLAELRGAYRGIRRAEPPAPPPAPPAPATAAPVTESARAPGTRASRASRGRPRATKPRAVRPAGTRPLATRPRVTRKPRRP
ncbi:hypothetical protein [Dactylosporangium sp. NPDC049140]|uniref:hypothetical protein n=1 Tax=Dactylosporangium sp. NPDC049140 TaxID=3155647 RepID=UPI0033E40833